MPKAVVLFDLDGTVIDSTSAIVESFLVAFENFKSESPTPENIISQIGHPLRIMFANLGVAEENLDEFIARYKQHYRSVCIDKTILLTNAKEALDLMAKYATLGVVTTKTSSFSKEILDHLGVGKYFATVVGFDDVKNPKPHPEPILLALDRLGVKGAKGWMIGDTPLDILAAKDAGVVPMGVLSGYSTRDKLAEYDCEIFEDLLGACKAIVSQLNV